MALRDKEDESHQKPKRTKTFYSSQNHHSIPILPNEIVIEILLRLPVKCILRCKSVCKSWHSQISEPHFVKSHLSFSTSNNDYAHHGLMLCGPRDYLRSAPPYNVMNGKSVSSLELDYPMKDPQNFVLIVGSCDGLLCIQVGEDALFICNPSTKRSNRLPCFGFKALMYGFGYDKSSDDYKVVVIYRPLQSGSKVKMYSLKSAKWKRIGNFPPGFPYNDYCAFSNGALHWVIGSYSRLSSSTIISLDLATETYGKVPQPVYDEGDKFLTLGALGESLCLLCNCYGNNGNRLDVWMMKVYGVQDSWTKLASFQNRNEFCWPSLVPCFPNDGKILLKFGPKIVLYNGKDSLSSEIENYGGSLEAWSWTIVESLVSPGGPQRRSSRKR